MRPGQGMLAGPQALGEPDQPQPAQTAMPPQDLARLSPRPRSVAGIRASWTDTLLRTTASLDLVDFWEPHA